MTAILTIPLGKKSTAHLMDMYQTAALMTERNENPLARFLVYTGLVNKTQDVAQFGNDVHAIGQSMTVVTKKTGCADLVINADAMAQRAQQTMNRLQSNLTERKMTYMVSDADQDYIKNVRKDGGEILRWPAPKQ